MERRDIVQLLASLDDDEFRALVDEARGAALIPLVELVSERLAPDVGTLAARLGDAVVPDDIGRRCVTRETARNLLAAEARRIADQQEREKARQAAMAETSAAHETRARVRALQAQQLGGGGGLVIEPPPWAL